MKKKAKEGTVVPHLQREETSGGRPRGMAKNRWLRGVLSGVEAFERGRNRRYKTNPEVLSFYNTLFDTSSLHAFYELSSADA